MDPSDDEEITWQTLQTQSSQVLVLTNAHLWSFAPQGLSKFGHLADGVLHLVTVAPTSRKEFLRYVKRNGDSRDQVGSERENAISAGCLILLDSIVSSSTSFPL